MEQPCAAPQNNVVFSPKVVSEAGARIKFSRGTVEHVGWEGLELIAQAIVQTQMAGSPPMVLEVEAAISVANIPLCLVAHRAGDALPLKHRGIQRGLSKRG